MDRKKAQAVLEAVQSKYAQWIQMSREDFGQTHPDDFPQLMTNWWGTRLPHERPVPFVVAWECNSPDEWAMHWNNEQPESLGVFCQPEFTFVLGIYDENDFEWDRVKRGSKFVHQHLIDEDHKPETCYITRTLKNGSAVSEVFYRVGDPKRGFLNKASAEYFAEHVVSFWED